MRTRVKLFESTISSKDLENQISNWSDGLNPIISKVDFNISTNFDFFQGQAPTICNQWNTYTCSVIYSLTTD